VSLPKRFAKASDMNSQSALVDRDVGPHAREQILLADDFACVLHQNDQNVECAAAQLKRDATPLEKSFRREQTEWTE
jgi:hypothetical protein